MSSVAEWQKVDDFRLDRDQIITVKVLGSGNFGQVSKAVYKPLNFEVAVKSLKGTLNFSNTLLYCHMKGDKISWIQVWLSSIISFNSLSEPRKKAIIILG